MSSVPVTLHPGELLARAIDVIEVASHHIFSEQAPVSFRSPTDLMALSPDEQDQIRRTEDLSFQSRPAISAVNFCLRSAISLLAVAHSLTEPSHEMSPCDRERAWKQLAVHTKLAGRAAYRASLILCDPSAGTVRGESIITPPPNAIQASLPLEPGSGTGEKVRILVVDDDSVIALLLQRTLARLGYEVAGVASTRDQAVEMAQRTQPDLVLMDINLGPGGDGIQAAEAIVHQRRTPVIFLTAYSEDPVLGRARGSGAYGYLLKPFSERGLHVTIQMALERYRSESLLADSERRLKHALDAIREPMAPEGPHTQALA
ncbi:response regulator [Variovorax sp. RA8]|uniref:response regulator n=1 Tax=Variovorax sp. (strain JCM 16519 / RA8) TaxID=662548 RepID=UPI001319B362|nr:response regulator [Variovorax sp. RA8]VTU29476.1 putative transcriptional regulatory protein pdtaR [Variovorax sp. RA8]